MKYNYKCNKCLKIRIIEQSMKDPLPRNIKCECGGFMNQDIHSKVKKLAFDLPLDFQSQESEYHSKDYGSDDAMEKMLGED